MMEVLAIEGYQGKAKSIESALSGNKPFRGRVHRSESVKDGLLYLAQDGHTADIVLLDLGDPDAGGMEGIDTLRANLSHVPVVGVLAEPDDDVFQEARNRGAQACLGREDLGSGRLVGPLLQSYIDQHRLKTMLQELQLVDKLTGLSNRRGFLALMHQQMKIADRTRKPLICLFYKIANYEEIIQEQGVQLGGIALMELGSVLREAYRDSDIIARTGSNEFIVVALEAHPKHERVLLDHLQSVLDAVNLRGSRSYRLDLKMNLVRYDPANPRPAHELLDQAESMLSY